MAGNVHLNQLSEHLARVAAEPSTPLDGKLLETCEILLGEAESKISESDDRKVREDLYYQIAQLLPGLQQDPSPLFKTTLRLAAPLGFDVIIRPDLTSGLQLSAQPFHPLILGLLQKAAGNSAFADALAAKPELIRSLVLLWLCAKESGTADQAGILILELLAVSKNAPPPLNAADGLDYGNGPVWKRLFDDKDIYELFYSICDLKSPLPDGVSLSKSDRTIAQARLMDWIPKVGALEWDSIATSKLPNVSHAHGVSSAEGLLQFAATKMVPQDDIVMQVYLMDFFTQLLVEIKQPVLEPQFK
jgi:hypothetical protein